MIVECCRLVVPALDRSSVRRGPTDCGVSECDREAWIMTRSWPTGGCCVIKKNYAAPCTYCIQGVPEVKVTTTGFNSRADSESKTTYTHVGPIRNGSGVMSFKYSK